MPAPLPMALTVVSAPKLGTLLGDLEHTMRSAPLPPLHTETIVVQSLGMRQWLQHQLARRLGCAASLHMPFPRDLAQDVARWLGTPFPIADPYHRDAMTWHLDALLGALHTAIETGSAAPPFAPLVGYLTAGDARMRAALAAAIADRFDDYQLFRAGMLDAWSSNATENGATLHEEASEHAEWQRLLWQQLVQRVTDAQPDARPLGARVGALIQELRTAVRPDGLPTRLTVFGVSSLPPMFVELLAALAQHADVTVYTALPQHAPPHPLAMRWGVQGRTLLTLLQQHGATVRHAEEADAHANALPNAHANARSAVQNTDSLLHALQRELATGAPAAHALHYAPIDRSLQLHATVGRYRELEVIRDQLYDAFDADPTLRADDVLVLVPDVAEWSADIAAVFSAKDGNTPSIPVTLADRRGRDNSAEQALLQLLALEGGRFPFSEVMALLQHPMVRRMAGLDEATLDALSRRVHDANVRWGYNDTHLTTLGFSDHDDMPSWRRGLDRLLMGVLVGDFPQQVNEVFPLAGDSAGDAERLGVLSAWVSMVAETLLSWREPRSLEQWGHTLADTVGALLRGATLDEKQAINALKERLRTLSPFRSLRHHATATDIPFAVIREHVEALFEQEGSGGSFVNGTVTVAALKPMRSIPFRIIAVAGLDDAAFPRRDRPVAFDLIAHAPRAGDRSLREDDRQLFLDMLLSAGDRLILTWSGYDPRDRSERARSIVLDELLAYLESRGVEQPDEQLIVRHPLHPFSTRYFRASDENASDERLFTYSRTAASAAVIASGERAHALGVRGVTVPLAHDDDTDNGTDNTSGVITLHDLITFWRHPVRWYCDRTLHVALPDLEEESSRDIERLLLNRLDSAIVSSTLLAQYINAPDAVPAVRRRMSARGELPPGLLGDAQFGKTSRAVQEVLARIANRVELTQGALRSVLPAREVQLQGHGYALHGTLEYVHGDTQYVAHVGRLSYRHAVRVWVSHVVANACAAQGAGAPRHTVVVWANKGEVQELALSPVDDAAELVDVWVRIMRDGLQRPLPLFPKGAEAVMVARRSGKPVTLGTVSGAWSQESYDNTPAGDNADQHVALCYGGDEFPAREFDAFVALTRALCPDGMAAGFPMVV